MKIPHHFSLNRQVFLNLMGLGILLAGISAAVFIHCRGEEQPLEQAVPDGGWERDGTLSPQDSKRLSADIERTWGKFGNLMFSHSGEELLHPKQVSLIILGGSLLVALGCFYVADA